MDSGTAYGFNLLSLSRSHIQRHAEAGGAIGSALMQVDRVLVACEMVSRMLRLTVTYIQLQTGELLERRAILLQAFSVGADWQVDRDPLHHSNLRSRLLS